MRAALRAFEEAIQHDGEYAPAWSGLADARTLLWDHGLTESDHALEKAQTAAERSRALAPEYAAAHLFVGQIHTARGRPAEAMASIERGLEFANARVRRRHLRYLAWLSVACARAGDVDPAREVLRRIREGHDDFAEGAARVTLGDAEGAFAAFDRAHWNPMHAMNLRFHPALDPIRDDPRFEELLRRVSETWGLRPDGSLPAEDHARALSPSSS